MLNAEGWKWEGGGPERKVWGEGALRAIDRDLETVSAKIRPLLVHIRQNLFEPSLTVKSLMTACGIKDNSVAILFHREVGRPPKMYITEKRFSTAALLLSGTKLKIWEVSSAVGYRSFATFSRAFEVRFGMRPSIFRKEVRAAKGEDGSLLAEEDAAESIKLSTLIAGLMGDLSEPDARALLEHLLELYPACRAQLVDGKRG